MADTTQVTPIGIVDEAQNLPAEFFRVLPPSDLLGVWLVGHLALAHFLKRGPYTAQSSVPVVERERFDERLHDLKRRSSSAWSL